MFCTGTYLIRHCAIERTWERTWLRWRTSGYAYTVLWTSMVKNPMNNNDFASSVPVFHSHSRSHFPWIPLTLFLPYGQVGVDIKDGLETIIQSFQSYLHSPEDNPNLCAVKLAILSMRFNRPAVFVDLTIHFLVISLGKVVLSASFLPSTGFLSLSVQ